ncbi:MAG: hypothetical protein LBM01_02365 [Christensenellaceae bacterium]|jgi:hypothetical protein|nr:hypothetical protein [Christensenellaceae bacterium]
MRNVAIAVACFLGFLAIFLSPTSFVEFGVQAIKIILTSLIPTLLPFFFLTSLICGLNLFSAKNSGAVLFFISVLCGYPTGAKTIHELYENKTISRGAAVYYSTWTSFLSPIFVIAVVGTYFLGDTRLGVMICASHILGALPNALIFRGQVGRTETQSLETFGKEPRGILTRATREEKPLSVADTLTASLKSVAIVCGYVFLFFVFINQAFFILNYENQILAGLLEITTGASLAQDPYLVCAMVALGGVCIALQSFVFMKSYRMPVKTYLLAKISQTIFAMLIFLFLYNAF